MKVEELLAILLSEDRKIEIEVLTGRGIKRIKKLASLNMHGTRKLVVIVNEELDSERKDGLDISTGGDVFKTVPGDG